MTLKTYQKAQAAADNPRSTEYRLFGQVTGALMGAGRAGLKGAELGHRDLAAVLQARRGQRLWTIELPGALPSILTGMEVAIVLATIGAVVAEYLAGDEGLGWLALRSLNGVAVDQLFGVIVLLSALGFALYAAVSVLRRVLVPWHPSVRRLDVG